MLLPEYRDADAGRLDLLSAGGLALAAIGVGLLTRVSVTSLMSAWLSYGEA